jgi:hypothetical protein
VANDREVRETTMRLVARTEMSTASLAATIAETRILIEESRRRRRERIAPGGSSLPGHEAAGPESD